MKKIIKLAAFLTIVCVISSAVLSYTNSVTSPIIIANQKAATEKMLKELVPTATEFTEEVIKENRIVKMYLAKKDGEVITTVYELSVFGFQSEIKTLVAIDPDGNFVGFKVIEQAETPGYGTKIAEEEYMSQFTNKTINDEIDIIAGSTVSTRPLKEAIENAVAHFKELNNK